MNRLFLSFIVGCFSTYNIGLHAQQSPVYGSQAGTMQPYNSNQGNDGYNNNGYDNGNSGYGNYNNQSYNNNQYGNNNNNQQNYNNNQQNNDWQNQYNNQYGGYNNNNPGVTNVSYNGNGYATNQQNNNNRVQSPNNPFLINYARKNKRFSATVYKMDKNGRLHRSQLDSKSLRKAIIIFFGDWCPHCAHFLTSFVKYINQLTASGIKIIFIGVPSIERIQNWQSPTISDYNESQQKLQSFGINPEQLSQNAKSEYEQAKQQKKNKQKHNSDVLTLNMPAVELVLLGDNSVLDNNAIDSLPTMLAINNGTEQFRGGADNSLDVVNFENPISMQQFKEIWYEQDDDDDEEDDDEDNDGDDEDTDDDDEEDNKKKVKKKNTKKKDKDKKKKESSDKKNKNKTKTSTTDVKNKNKNKKSKNSKISNESSKSVDISLTNFHTRLLNKGCNCSCNMPQVIIKHIRTPVQVVQKPTPPPQQRVQQQVICIQKDQFSIDQQPIQQQIKAVQNQEVDEQFIEEEQAPRKGIKCIKRNPRELCSSRIKKIREKVRDKIEDAIEKHENNKCYCS